MKSYPGFSEEYWSEEMPGAQSWVYYNWAVENEMNAFGATSERKGDGYIRQEMRKIIAERKAKR